MNQAATQPSAKTFNSGFAHKVWGALVAVAAVLILQGSLLAGFDNLARATTDAASSPTVATLPAVTIVGRRG